MVYLVSYDLRNKRRNYSGVVSELQKSSGWWHYLESTWLIVTNETVDQVVQRLRPHIDSNDSLLVIEVTRNYQGWLPEEAWEWINRVVF